MVRNHVVLLAQFLRLLVAIAVDWIWICTPQLLNVASSLVRRTMITSVECVCLQALLFGGNMALGTFMHKVPWNMRVEEKGEQK